jgi:hypothetical protein
VSFIAHGWSRTTCHFHEQFGFLFILLIDFNVYLRYKGLLVAQRQTIIAVKCAEEESVRLTSEMAEAKRINHIMDKKYRTFVDVLDKLNHINQGPLIMACVAF